MSLQTIQALITAWGGVPCYKLDVFTLREDEPVRVKCACLRHKLLPRHFAP